MDIFSPDKRSRIMRGSKGKDTKPELLVRRLLHRLGYRYRLHGKDLPGKPDLIFRRRKKAIFVHGCFWHQHRDANCPIARKPASNTPYWTAKFERNTARDRQVIHDLRAAGWNVHVVWECQLAAKEQLESDLVSFLGPRS